MDKLLTEIQVSEALQVSLACLRRWRLRGEGPQYIKVNPHCNSPLESVQAEYPSTFSSRRRRQFFKLVRLGYFARR
jgi:hypothetical protein